MTPRPEEASAGAVCPWCRRMVRLRRRSRGGQQLAYTHNEPATPGAGFSQIAFCPGSGQSIEEEVSGP